MSTYRTDPANIYYNASVFNNTGNIVVAEYTSYRNTVLINNPAEYYMRIERFDSSNILIPLMIINDQSLSITIDATSTGGSVFRQYVPIISNSSLPQLYGHIFDIDVFIEMINSALASAHVGSGAIGNRPIFYSNRNGELSFLIDEQYYNNGTEIWFNNNLGLKISSFVLYGGFLQNDPPLQNGKVYRLTYYPSPSNYLSRFPASSTDAANPLLYNLYKVDQQFSSIFLLSDVNRIVVTTSQMPTLREFITGRNDSSVNVTLGVLFTVPVNDSFQSLSQKIDYRPPQAKLIDIISQEPLNTIDYKVYYQTTNGNLYPVYIEPGKSFEITFGFIHRSINDNAYTFNKLGL